MNTVSPGCFTHRNDSSNVAQGFLIGVGYPALRTDERFQILQLGATHRRLNVTKPIVVAYLIVNILDRILLRLGSQVSCPGCPGFVVSDDHPAAASGNNLIPVKTKATDIGQATHRTVLVFRSEAFGRILDNDKLVLASRLHNVIGIYRMT